jgi:hypothetical protein
MSYRKEDTVTLRGVDFDARVQSPVIIKKLNEVAVFHLGERDAVNDIGNAHGRLL